MLQRILDLSGVDGRPVSHAERIVSLFGAFAGIALVLFTARLLAGDHGNPLVVASMGASAVLLFAVPHGNLSQPWPLLGGQILSAFIGVTCGKLIPYPVIAPAIAVGLAVGVMHYLRCIHPPGGATALASSFGPHAAGYGFMLDPVLFNTLVILSAAVLYNWPFTWRRYPAALAKRQKQEAVPGYEPIAHEDFVYALSQIDSFIDVSEQDLSRIYELATKRHSARIFPPAEIKLGHCYSNEEYGPLWSVRQIVDESEDSVIFKTVAGAERRSSGVMKKSEFALWARHEVVLEEGNWRR
ncbi:MAG TPA: HPP family protein, partial [Burkholderiales bacterium]|nr:HPP family protein [Burkholderiales bacterium]